MLRLGIFNDEDEANNREVSSEEMRLQQSRKGDSGVIARKDPPMSNRG
jgi:hypothetical protein